MPGGFGQKCTRIYIAVIELPDENRRARTDSWLRSSVRRITARLMT